MHHQDTRKRARTRLLRSPLSAQVLDLLQELCSELALVLDESVSARLERCRPVDSKRLALVAQMCRPAQAAFSGSRGRVSGVSEGSGRV